MFVTISVVKSLFIEYVCDRVKTNDMLICQRSTIYGMSIGLLGIIVVCVRLNKYFFIFM